MEHALGYALAFLEYHLYVPPSHLDDLKVTRFITTRRTIKEMAPLTSQITIFGATGDLCKRKLIPSLFKLHEKKLLPDNLVIVGTSRREISKKAWLADLGKYPEDFVHRLDWHSSDLENEQSLRNLPTSDDNTYFLSVPPERYESAIVNLKEAGLLDDPERTRVIIEKPFGTDLQSVSYTHLRAHET